MSSLSSSLSSYRLQSNVRTRTDSDSSGTSSDEERTQRMKVQGEKLTQQAQRAATNAADGGTRIGSSWEETNRSDSCFVSITPSGSNYNSSHHQKSLHLSSATDTAAPSQAGRSSRPPLWSCFLGCGKSYKKSSGRSIRRHVLACYREHHQAECEDITDEQLNVLIAVKQEQCELQTGLRAWRFRRQRRSAATLPSVERWQCPNGECIQCYRSTSVQSIAKHQVRCIHNPRKRINVHNLTLSPAATLVLREAQAKKSSYQTNNLLQTQQFQQQQPGTVYPPHLQITMQLVQQHPSAMMPVSLLFAPLTTALSSAQYGLNAADVTLPAESSALLHLPATAPLQLLPIKAQVSLNPTALPLVVESVTNSAAINLHHYLQSIPQQNYTQPTTHSLVPPLPSPSLQPTALPVPSPRHPVPTQLSIISKRRSAFKKPSLTADQQSSTAQTEAM